MKELLSELSFILFSALRVETQSESVCDRAALISVGLPAQWHHFPWPRGNSAVTFLCYYPAGFYSLLQCHLLLHCVTESNNILPGALMMFFSQSESMRAGLVKWYCKYKEIVYLKMEICWKCAHHLALQDVDEFLSSSDLEKFSIASLAYSGSSVVNGCHQNESLSSWQKHNNPHDSSRLINGLYLYETKPSLRYFNFKLESCGLLLDYCGGFISYLNSHSDGTHSLQRTHWRARDAMPNFSKTVLVNK